MKKIFVSITVVATALAMYLYTRQNFPTQPAVSPSPVVKAQPSPEAALAKVEINFGDDKVIAVDAPVTAESTAFSLLQDVATAKVIKIETKQYDFGTFVESIDGSKSTAEKSWIYFVNGASGQVAADKQVVKAGDLVEWKYVTPE